MWRTLGDGWVLAGTGALGLFLSVVAFVRGGGGVAGTPGAALLAVTTGLLAFAGAVLSVAACPRSLRAALVVLALLDLAGTAGLAWFLHLQVLFALMVVGAIAWLMVRGAGRHSSPARGR